MRYHIDQAVHQFLSWTVKEIEIIAVYSNKALGYGLLEMRDSVGDKTP